MNNKFVNNGNIKKARKPANTPRIIELMYKYWPNIRFDGIGKIFRLKMFRRTLSDALFSGPPLMPLVFEFNGSPVSKLMREVLSRLDTFVTDEDKVMIAKKGVGFWKAFKSELHSEIRFYDCEPSENPWDVEAAINEFFGPEVEECECDIVKETFEDRFDSYRRSVFCVFAALDECIDIKVRDDLLYQVMDFEVDENFDFEAELDVVTSREEVLLFKTWLKKFVKPLEFYRRETA